MVVSVCLDDWCFVVGKDVGYGCEVFDVLIDYVKECVDCGLVCGDWVKIVYVLCGLVFVSVFLLGGFIYRVWFVLFWWVWLCG